MKGDGQTVVRGGYGRFYDKTPLRADHRDHHRGRLLGLLHRELPRERRRPRSLAGPGAHEPLSRGRADGEPRSCSNAQFPPGTKTKNTGTVFLDSPDRVIPYTDQFTIGFERALWPQLLARRRLRPRQRTRPVHVAREEPGRAGRHLAHRPHRARRSQLHGLGAAARERGRDRLRRAAGGARAALGEQLPLPRLVHARQVARQHLRQRHPREQPAAPRRHEPRPERGARPTSTAATTSW